jgi:deazaflavin-dependent oxidoreductase (nitroreductase family)
MGREPQYLSLTTRGRRSGRPRQIEIWFTRRDGRYYVIAEHRERAHWVRNLRADPRVRVRVGRGAVFPARARVVDARRQGALAGQVRRRSTAKYGWGDGLVVELAPAGSARRPRRT